MRLTPHLRAIFVLLHVAAITIAAVPAPIRSDRRAWKDPTLQHEIKSLAGRLGRLGWDVSPDRLEQFLWDTSSAYIDLMDHVKRPFQRYYAWAGTEQGWGMFVAAHRYPAVASIEIHSGGAWSTIYEARSAQYTWNAGQFDDMSFRYLFFLYEWPGYQHYNEPLLRCLAARIARDFPAADRVRLRYRKGAVPSPDEVRRGSHPNAADHLTYTYALRRQP